MIKLKNILNEQIESTIITSKELLKLEKKAGWGSGTGQLPISKIAPMDSEWYTFDGVASTGGSAELAANNLFNKWADENGVTANFKRLVKKIMKVDSGKTYIKLLYPASKVQK